MLMLKALFAMFSEINRQIQPSSCKQAQGKPIYLPSTFRGNRNKKFEVKHESWSENITVLTQPVLIQRYNNVTIVT